MEDKKNGVLDVSSFFLVEDSGDSELDRGPSMAAVAGADDEDDAESCSCNDTIKIEGSFDDFYEVIHDDDKDEEHQNYVGSIDEAIGSYNICREVMDGMEDRLFWETCMAIGYPMN
ncbi:hypothetical protein HRI_000703900 [Hibiscus trionum]|uniref:Uncharacterized protein n=1 Tax=Hibiscus trionum TaxID=183268 RepID=A0A9W7H5E3_HIBTR|nr:hypothetical protein HRI_000703900 [Hibiscus trionum]